MLSAAEGFRLTPLINFIAGARLCQNVTNHPDVMLSESEASAFLPAYEKRILRLRLIYESFVKWLVSRHQIFP
jgi:hypothetical protein